jgi:malate dehydrogenase (oxaloacetate-decarboxylating)
MFAHVAQVIAQSGANLGAIDLVRATRALMVRDVTVDVADEGIGEQLRDALGKLDGVRIRAVSDRTFLIHLGGKVEMIGRVQVRTRDDLSLVYTPGVARVSRAIAADPDLAWTLTMKPNTVAIVSDGSAVLGLGNIGPLGALPVMEGKSLLFRDLAGISAFPIVLDVHEPSEIVKAVVAIAPGFGGINLEDIAAPGCFEVERELRDRLDIPVFHDDQHGTAVVVLAALRNAAAVTGAVVEELRVVISGAGAAGIATARLLHRAGIRQILVVDRTGVVNGGRADLTAAKRSLVEEITPTAKLGSLADALAGANVLIGLSSAGLVSTEMLRTMARPRIVFGLANPDPEVDPLTAASEVDVLATGRSDYPNQVNNVLAFPGIFRGLLDVRSSAMTTEMELAAADALAATVPAKLRSSEYILPSVFDKRVVPAIARAVANAARAAGVARRHAPLTAHRPS